MTVYVVGVDLSTKRSDAALIPLHGRGVVTVATEHVPPTSDGDAARVRLAHLAARRCLATLRNAARPGWVALVAVEQPAAGGTPAILASLAPVYGAVCAAANGDELVVGLRPNEWRGALGLRSAAPRDVGADASSPRQRQAARKDWLKQQSVTTATRLLAAEGHTVPLDTHDAAEALLVAFAARITHASDWEAA